MNVGETILAIVIVLCVTSIIYQIIDSKKNK